MTYQQLYDSIIAMPDQQIKVCAETIISTHHTASVIYSTLEYYRRVYPRKITQPMKVNKNNLQKIYDVLYHEKK